MPATKTPTNTDEKPDEAAPVAEATETPKVSNRPTYGIGATFDDLPTGDKAPGRESIYLDLLGAIKTDETKHGKWVEIATFKTRQGAKTAQNEISKGKRQLPKVDSGMAWSFGSRAFNTGEVDESGKPVRISKLYARYGVKVTEPEAKAS